MALGTLRAPASLWDLYKRPCLPPAPPYSSSLKGAPGEVAGQSGSGWRRPILVRQPSPIAFPFSPLSRTQIWGHNSQQHGCYQ